MDRAGEAARGVAGLLRIREPLELPGRGYSGVGTAGTGERIEEATLESDMAIDVVEEPGPPLAVEDRDGISSEVWEL